MDTTIYKNLLLERQNEVEAELKAVGIHNPQNASDWIAVPRDLDAEEPDDNLAADAVESWNERASLVVELEKAYNTTRAALARIEAGTYGVCEVCGVPIEEKRLHAAPTARTCIAHIDQESELP